MNQHHNFNKVSLGVGTILDTVIDVVQVDEAADDMTVTVIVTVIYGPELVATIAENWAY